MKIITFFTENSIPKEGLSPIIRIRNASSGVLIITDALMSEVGDGFYKYDFIGYDSSIDYAIRCDGGIILSNDERYSYGSNDNDQTEEIWAHSTRTLTEGTKDSEIDAIKAKTDNLPVDPASETNATANKDEIIDTINGITIDLDNLEILIKRILGLVQENFRITSTTYNAAGLLTSATTKIYPTKADCDANTNPIATYLLTAVYDAENNCTSYKMVKE